MVTKITSLRWGFLSTVEEIFPILLEFFAKETSKPREEHPYVSYTRGGARDDWGDGAVGERYERLGLGHG